MNTITLYNIWIVTNEETSNIEYVFPYPCSVKRTIGLQRRPTYFMGGVAEKVISYTPTNILTDLETIRR